MTINGINYSYEGTIHAGPNTRRVAGVVLDVVLKGKRGAYYTLTCWENGATALYDSKIHRISRNPEVS